MTTPHNSTPDVLIVGAGFAGMYLLHKMRQNGFSAVVVEAAPNVGGTWYNNRYPGLRCDVESQQYSFSFSEELRNAWNWSERYAAQPEILAYANMVADTLELRPSITFNTRIASAHWDEAAARWQVTAEDGQTWQPRWFIMATGALSVPRLPNIQGIASFKGQLVHPGDWPVEGVDLAGKTVGIIGTGSSGVQVATAIAPIVGHLSVFQRTPAYSIPAQNHPLSDELRQSFRDNFSALDAWARTTGGGIMAGPARLSALDVSDEVRERMLTEAWRNGGSFPFTATFNDIRTNEKSNQLVAEFVRNRIRATVKNPKTAELLCPTDLIATRRVCVDTGYYQIFNRDNVSLVDTKSDPITEVTQTGLKLASGTEIALDVLILATGYDAMTGAMLAVDIGGRDGVSLRDAWHGGPKAYIGLMSAGFPNLFMITGPGSPSVLSNVIRSIEHHVEWISDCLNALHKKQINVIEVEPEAQETWVAHVNEVASKTLYTRGASWYMGADIPGKPKVFMPYAGGLPTYVKRCKEIAEDDFRGFRLSGKAE
jgi:cyclohexanone monooxygenase